MARDIFISYSREDLKKVRTIKDELERVTGVECWMDLEGIESGAVQFTKSIIAGIRNSRVFLFMLSARSQRSKFALRELEFASKRAEKDEDKHVVIVNIDGCQMTDEFEFMYGLTDTIAWENKPQQDKLLRDVRKWTGNENIDANHKDEEKVRRMSEEVLRSKKKLKYHHGEASTRKILSNKFFYAIIGSVAILCLLAIIFFSGAFSRKKNELKPVAESFAVRYERAKQMMMNCENSVTATAGLDSLKQLSNEGYSQATFLWSRIIFDNQDIQYGLDNPEWKRIKSALKGYEPIDNMRAHELLELAVIQDREGQNWQALAELGYDYYKGRDRCKEYEKILSEGRNEDPNKDENLRKAKEYFTKAAAHPEADPSKTSLEIENIKTMQAVYSSAR